MGYGTYSTQHMQSLWGSYTYINVGPTRSVSKRLKFESCSHVGYRGGGGSDCSHCRSTSLQPRSNFWFWGGVWLQSLQINFRKFCDFTCTLCPEPWNLFAPSHSMRSTGWPLVHNYELILFSWIEISMLCLLGSTHFIDWLLTDQDKKLNAIKHFKMCENYS